MIMPMRFRISSEYGVLEEVRGGRVHRGIDLAMPRGTELHTIVDGTVERIVNSPLLGNGVFIRTADGDVHIYGHLDKVTVRAGDRVDAGDLLGLSGSSGHSTGPHLHFGLIHDGRIADPTPLVDAVQQYSGEIAGPAIFGVKGPATLMLTRGPADAIKDHAIAAAKHHIWEWIQAAAGVVVDLSYGVALIGCSVLIILGALGLRDGYRWAGITFGAYALIRLLGVAR